MLFDRKNPEHVKAAAFMEAVEVEERQRAIEIIERGHIDGDPGVPFDDFLAFYNLPRRVDDGV